MLLRRNSAGSGIVRWCILSCRGCNKKQKNGLVVVCFFEAMLLFFMCNKANKCKLWCVDGVMVVVLLHDTSCLRKVR